MSHDDPAVKAAKRTADRMSLPFTQELVTAASEALKPLRELHKPGFVTRTSERNTRYEYQVKVCDEYQYEWPCETAPLVYSADELSAT